MKNNYTYFYAYYYLGRTAMKLLYFLSLGFLLTVSHLAYANETAIKKAEPKTELHQKEQGTKKNNLSKSSKNDKKRELSFTNLTKGGLSTIAGISALIVAGINLRESYKVDKTSDAIDQVRFMAMSIAMTYVATQALQSAHHNLTTA